MASFIDRVIDTIQSTGRKENPPEGRKSNRREEHAAKD